MNTKNIQSNHSLISSYPIDYNIFPLAKNCRFIEIDLNENEYIFIPAFWMHWIFTEPYNISMNYFIYDINYDINNDEENLFINNIKKKKPFTKKIEKKYNFNFNDFFKNILSNKFNIVFSSNNNLTPVKKPDTEVIFVKNISIKESLSLDYKDYFKYIGQNHYYDPYLSNLENFITSDVNNYILYKSSIWINLDKSINSGLHYDGNDNILINFIGKKKILLAHPCYYKYMYFQVFPKIEKR